MLWRSHLIAGACAGLAIAGHANMQTLVLYAGVSGVAALLPDIDSYKSFIGRKAPISMAINLIAGHRGVFHSLVASLVFTGLFMCGVRFKFPAYVNLTIPFFVGYLSHLALDFFNPSGVPLFWPWPVHLRLPLVSTGSFLERMIVIPLLTALFFCLISVHIWEGVKL